MIDSQNDPAKVKKQLCGCRNSPKRCMFWLSWGWRSETTHPSMNLKHFNVELRSMFRDRYWVFLVQEHLSNRNQVQNKDKTTVLPTVVSHREIVISATGLPGFTSPSLGFWVIQRLNSDQIRTAALDVLQKSSFSPQIALETSELVKMPIQTAQFDSESRFIW